MPELTRSVIGNKADELGAVDAGADAEGINSSSMPSGRDEPIEVDVSRVEDGIQLVPSRETDAFRRAIGELEEGPNDLLMAQLVEEPEEVGLVKRVVNGIEVEARDDRLAEISHRTPREGLVWYGSHPEYMQAMAGDRVLIRKDVLELEDACKSCHGRGYDESAVCQHCGGNSRVWDEAAGQTFPCISCVVLGYDRETQWSCGRVKCSACYGTGWRAGVVIPQVAERKPITGIIVSVGPDCKLYKLGDRVIHSRFAGHEMTVSKNESFVMMRECEILSILRQRHA
jgi:co-chaperonin GroES (HSP10)